MWVFELMGVVVSGGNGGKPEEMPSFAAFVCKFLKETDVHAEKFKNTPKNPPFQPATKTLLIMLKNLFKTTNPFLPFPHQEIRKERERVMMMKKKE